jgi:hypothetical protein
MTENIYKKVEQFVIDTFSKAGDDHGIKHCSACQEVALLPLSLVV